MRWSSGGCAHACQLTSLDPSHPSFSQVHYDPEATGPRHLVDAVEAVGFEASPVSGQRLGALGLGLVVLWRGLARPGSPWR